MGQTTLPLSALLALSSVELAVFRAILPAVRGLGPNVSKSTALVARVLESVGLFLHYSISLLGIALLVICLSRFNRTTDLGNVLVRRLAVFSGAVFSGFIVVSLLFPLSEHSQFLLELFFTGALLFCVGLLFSVVAPVLPKIGVAVVVAPLIFHFYGPFAVRTFAGESALWAGLPEKVQYIGAWMVIVAGMVLPVLWLGRSKRKDWLRSGPLVTASLVSIVAHVALRYSQEGAIVAAMEGLGIDIGPTSHPSIRIGCMVALFTTTWVFLTCVTSKSPARSRLGVGLGLILAGGYGCRWPVQLTLQLLGAFAMIGAVVSIGLERQFVEEKAPAN